ncbi:methylated-DNA--[protein]-cysteine S-methyltransferase [Metabacillus sp. RGM 3146]|uniref:methylated-DNA--[protein]-cysteine S-methyltransferase n=1 Tax=Metabacillus sp. RGM 3146 TaxID=3401092 RepID=UPI003B997398
MYQYQTLDSPLGKLAIVSSGERITHLMLSEEDLELFKKNFFAEEKKSDLLDDAIQQLKEYFDGNREVFELPLSFKGTDFQEEVWNELCNIPYGESRSYGELAEKIGRPKAVRAVGQANRANRLPIFIPCHRVIGKNKSLTGYAGTKTNLKDLLLTLEGTSFAK